MRRALIVAAGFLVGCKTADLGKALDASVVVIERAEPCMAGMKKAEDAKCEGDAACLAKVKESWAPVADALDTFNAFLCGISPDAEGCK